MTETVNIPVDFRNEVTVVGAQCGALSLWNHLNCLRHLPSLPHRNLCSIAARAPLSHLDARISHARQSMSWHPYGYLVESRRFPSFSAIDQGALHFSLVYRGTGENRWIVSHFGSRDTCFVNESSRVVISIGRLQIGSKSLSITLHAGRRSTRAAIRSRSVRASV